MSEHDLSPKGPFPGPQDALEFRGCGLNPCGDRLALSASLSAQAAEIERLTRERDEALARCGELAIDQITANNRATAAEAEAARLREALFTCATVRPSTHVSLAAKENVQRLINVANAARGALEPKP